MSKALGTIKEAVSRFQWFLDIKSVSGGYYIYRIICEYNDGQWIRAMMLLIVDMSRLNGWGGIVFLEACELQRKVIRDIGPSVAAKGIFS